MTAFRNTSPYGPLSRQRLRDLEKKLGAALPAEYRAFLIEYNGGSVEPSGFWIERDSDAGGVHQLYGLHDGPDGLSVDDWLSPDQTGIPRNVMAIGGDGAGNCLCIGISGSERGSVFFIDHELHGPGMADSMEGITKVGDSFNHFLSILEDLPN